MPAPSTRTEPRQSRFYSIQILRGLAAVLVVLHHQSQQATPAFDWHPATRFFDNGAFGVDLFFPISGFVMYLTATSALRRNPKKPAWQDFAWRRLLRIAPLYWFFTIVKLALFFAVPATMLHYRFQIMNTLAAFFFIPTFNFEHSPEPPLAVGWTLNCEMFFYVIVAACLAFRQPILRFCAAVIVGAVLLSLFLPHRFAISYLADPIDLEFLAGMFIAAFVAQLRRLPMWLPFTVLTAALGYALLFAPGGSRLAFQPLRALYYGIPGALIVASVVALEPRFRMDRLRFLLLLGDASYSLYLIHTFIIPATRFLVHPLHLNGAGGIVLFFLLGLSITVACAVAFHLYVELPCLAVFLRRRLPWSLHSADA